MNALVPAPRLSPLIDGFGRRLSYVRLSVTDRCDLRCTYCMSEHPTFLPRGDLLSFEEMERLALFLIAGGVERLRITGGEPLVRKGIGDFLVRLGEAGRVAGLKELTLTTNGTLLERSVPALVAAGIRRIGRRRKILGRMSLRRRIKAGGILSLPHPALWKNGADERLLLARPAGFWNQSRRGAFRLPAASGRPGDHSF